MSASLSAPASSPGGTSAPAADVDASETPERHVDALDSAEGRDASAASAPPGDDAQGREANRSPSRDTCHHDETRRGRQTPFALALADARRRVSTTGRDDSQTTHCLREEPPAGGGVVHVDASTSARRPASSEASSPTQAAAHSAQHMPPGRVLTAGRNSHRRAARRLLSTDALHVAASIGSSSVGSPLVMTAAAAPLVARRASARRSLETRATREGATSRVTYGHCGGGGEAATGDVVSGPERARPSRLPTLAGGNAWTRARTVGRSSDPPSGDGPARVRLDATDPAATRGATRPVGGESPRHEPARVAREDARADESRRGEGRPTAMDQSPASDADVDVAELAVENLCDVAPGPFLTVEECGALVAIFKSPTVAAAASAATSASFAGARPSAPFFGNDRAENIFGGPAAALLSRLPLLRRLRRADCYAAAAAAVAGAATLRELTGPAGSPLMSEGETGRDVHVVLSGSVEVAVGGWGHTAAALGTDFEPSVPADGSPGTPVGRLSVGPGACLGARSMLLGVPRDASATATSGTVTVLTIAAADYRQALLRTVAAAALVKIPLLADLPPSVRSSLLRRARRQCREPGTLLFEAGTEAAEETLVLVGSGSLQLVAPMPAGAAPGFERHLRFPTAGAARAAAAGGVGGVGGEGAFRRGCPARVRGLEEAGTIGLEHFGEGVVRRGGLTGGKFLGGVPVARLGSGSSFGEASLTGGSPGKRAYSGFCLGVTEVWTLDRSEVDAVVAESIGMGTIGGARNENGPRRPGGVRDALAARLRLALITPCHDRTREDCETIADALCHAPLLARLRRSAVLEVARGVRYERADRGQALYRRGDVADRVFFCVSGRVRVGGSDVRRCRTNRDADSEMETQTTTYTYAASTVNFPGAAEARSRVRTAELGASGGVLGVKKGVGRPATSWGFAQAAGRDWFTGGGGERGLDGPDADGAAVVGPGEHFGDEALTRADVAGHARTSGAVALDPCEFATLDGCGAFFVRAPVESADADGRDGSRSRGDENAKRRAEMRRAYAAASGDAPGVFSGRSSVVASRAWW